MSLDFEVTMPRGFQSACGLVSAAIWGERTNGQRSFIVICTTIAAIVGALYLTSYCIGDDVFNLDHVFKCLKDNEALSISIGLAVLAIFALWCWKSKREDEPAKDRNVLSNPPQSSVSPLAAATSLPSPAASATTATATATATTTSVTATASASSTATVGASSSSSSSSEDRYATLENVMAIFRPHSKGVVADPMNLSRGGKRCGNVSFLEEDIPHSIMMGQIPWREKLDFVVVKIRNKSDKKVTPITIYQRYKPRGRGSGMHFFTGPEVLSVRVLGRIDEEIYTSDLPALQSLVDGTHPHYELA